jgi:hypothetical protein
VAIALSTWRTDAAPGSVSIRSSGAALPSALLGCRIHAMAAASCSNTSIAMRVTAPILNMRSVAAESMLASFFSRRFAVVAGTCAID